MKLWEENLFRKYFQVYRGFISISTSTVKVKLWRILKLYKINWNPDLRELSLIMTGGGAEA